MQWSTIMFGGLDRGKCCFEKTLRKFKHCKGLPGLHGILFKEHILPSKIGPKQMLPGNDSKVLARSSKLIPER